MRPDPLIDPPAIGRIYFVHDEPAGFVKIGLTIDVLRRVSELQCGNPHCLRLLGDMPGTLEDEKALQQRFKSFRWFREWFFASQVLLDFIKDHCDDHVHTAESWDIQAAEAVSDDVEVPF